MLDIGSFDRKIRVLSSTITQDDMGGSILTYTTKWEGWAFVEWKDGKTSDDNEMISSEMHIEFTIRNIGSTAEEINANNMQVSFPLGNSETQNYEIVGIKIWGGRNKYKTLITTVIANNKQTS